MSGGNDLKPANLSVVEPAILPVVDLSKPRYDQTTYVGRAKHFFETANPKNVFVSSKRLEEAAKMIRAYNKGEAPPGTTVEQLYAAKVLYDSAYHPDTGEKMFIVGRMSFQVPGNMTIIGCMLTFYRTPAAVIFWQWVNQTFNSIVNYTNRSGDEVFTTRQILVPYVAATGAATITALTLNQIVAKRAPPLVGRFVPFVAVAAANAINIPLMRQRELRTGVPIYNEENTRLGLSTRAAEKGIAQVIFSRIFMATPGMLIPPVIMNALDKRGVFKRMPWLNAPLQIFLVGFCLVFATPLCCAIFPQQSSMSVSYLESELRESLKRKNVNKVYFNKGL